jgi:hypothetical protein
MSFPAWSIQYPYEPSGHAVRFRKWGFMKRRKA